MPPATVPCTKKGDIVKFSINSSIAAMRSALANCHQKLNEIEQLSQQNECWSARSGKGALEDSIKLLRQVEITLDIASKNSDLSEFEQTDEGDDPVISPRALIKRQLTFKLPKGPKRQRAGDLGFPDENQQIMLSQNLSTSS